MKELKQMMNDNKVIAIQADRNIFENLDLRQKPKYYAREILFIRYNVSTKVFEKVSTALYFAEHHKFFNLNGCKSKDMQLLPFATYGESHTYRSVPYTVEQVEKYLKFVKKHFGLKVLDVEQVEEVAQHAEVLSLYQQYKQVRTEINEILKPAEKTVYPSSRKTSFTSDFFINQEQHNMILCYNEKRYTLINSDILYTPSVCALKESKNDRFWPIDFLTHSNTHGRSNKNYTFGNVSKKEMKVVIELLEKLVPLSQSIVEKEREVLRNIFK